MPRVEAMWQDYHDLGYEPLAINLGEAMSTVKVYARQYDFQFLSDANYVVWGLYKINNSIPLNYVIDTSQNQLVIGRMEGFNETTIRGWIEPYLVGIGEGKNESALQPISVRPNPTSRSVTIQFTPAHSGAVTARIYSTSGQLVRTLRGAGQTGIIWNLQDDSGQKVANGVYVCQLNNVEINILVLR
ncbi:MAG: T9SS type A sorting domain-containing protein [Candidatus Parcubacteria bacterium]|nr:T9SS type A sorting domain-containing protein [Candidatus Parcubacteria bacterium]